MGVAYPAPEEASISSARLRQFDSVRLLEDLPASAVMFLDDGIRASVIAAGATGAVVDVYADGRDLYEVELTSPIPALATLNGSQIERR